ncbi:hypothetical protein BH11ARM2_BH11ARM2_07010 [soil metagenome]
MAFADSFKTFPEIRTARLILNEIHIADSEDFHREQRSALDAPDRAPFEFGFETQSVKNVIASIGFAQSAWQKKSKLRFAIRLRSTEPRLIGCCELFNIQSHYKAELGYWLGLSYQNQGLMTEAVKAVVHHAFENMRMGRLYAQTSTQNIASIEMLKKVGFLQEGVLRRSTYRGGVWDETALMGILAKDVSAP